MVSVHQDNLQEDIIILQVEEQVDQILMLRVDHQQVEDLVD